MRINTNPSTVTFKNITTNTLPRLTEEQKRELEYIKKKCEMEQVSNERRI